MKSEIITMARLSPRSDGSFPHFGHNLPEIQVMTLARSTRSGMVRLALGRWKSCEEGNFRSPDAKETESLLISAKNSPPLDCRSVSLPESLKRLPALMW